MSMYHAHVDEVADTNAGLMGAVVVTRRGAARPDGSPKGVDRELFELFSVINENESPYLPRNVTAFAQAGGDTSGEEFNESNLMHSIIGYVCGNQPLVTMQPGQHVRWYVMAMGSEVDLHTPHWHGNTVTVNGMRADVVNLLPATMVVADMTPDAEGTWLRLGVAASLLRSPKLLALDEPANRLDPAGIWDMRDLVKRLTDEGLTVLLSSHDMAEVEDVCDNVTIMLAR